MNYTFKDDSPIFQQLAKALEDDIFLGTYEEGTAIPSTTELSVALHINPATVLKDSSWVIMEQVSIMEFEKNRIHSGGRTLTSRPKDDAIPSMLAPLAISSLIFSVKSIYDT